MIKEKLRTSYLIIISIVISLGLSISLQSILAVWAPPTDAPPANNVAAPLNTSSTGQAKEGGLIINTTGAASNGLIVQNGNTGLGTIAPGANKLHVYTDSATENVAVRATINRTTGSNYAVTGTAGGSLATKNVGLYGWAEGANGGYIFDNLGLLIQEGLSKMDDGLFIGDKDSPNVSSDWSTFTPYGLDNYDSIPLIIENEDTYIQLIAEGASTGHSGLILTEISPSKDGVV